MKLMSCLFVAVYAWGYNGYCRLGLGCQQDVLAPKIVPQFAGPNKATMGAEAMLGEKSLRWPRHWNFNDDVVCVF